MSSLELRNVRVTEQPVAVDLASTVPENHLRVDVTDARRRSGTWTVWVLDGLGWQHTVRTKVNEVMYDQGLTRAKATISRFDRGVCTHRTSQVF